MRLNRNGKDYDVPVDWKDITLSRWQRGVKFARAHMPEGLLKEFDGGKREEVAASEIVRWKSDWVGHWLGFSYQEMQTLPMGDGKLEVGVNTLYDSLSKFLSFPFENAMETFEFNGLTYKVATSTLDAVGEKVPMGKANWGEMEDAMLFQENVSHIGKGKEDALGYMLATLYKPTEPQTYDERCELFKELPMDIVIGCAFFLTQLPATYFKSLSRFLKAQEKDTTSDGIPQPLVLRGKVYSEPTMTLENGMLTTSLHT